MKLIYSGIDDWNRPTFEVENTGTYVKDINCGNKPMFLCWSNPKNDPNGEADYPFDSEDIELIGYDPDYKELSIQYMFLDRLRSDCEYYLGYGDRSPRYLHEQDERLHIEEMKRIYDLFPDDMKPEWLSLEDIEEYERKMCDGK